MAEMAPVTHGDSWETDSINIQTKRSKATRTENKDIWKFHGCHYQITEKWDDANFVIAGRILLVFIITTYNATSENKVGIMKKLSFQWSTVLFPFDMVENLQYIHNTLCDACGVSFETSKSNSLHIIIVLHKVLCYIVQMCCHNTGNLYIRCWC